MKQNPQQNDRELFNSLVETAYTTIVKQTKIFLACIERDELRCILERKSPLRTPNTIIHEIVSPLLYVRLSCELDSCFAIHFGIEPIKEDIELNTVTAQFLRLLFKQTSKDMTECDIEHCIRTDWFINCCNDMFEYVDMQQKYHTLKKIPYKVSDSKRKKILAVV